MKTKVICNMTSLSFMITDKCNLRCKFCSRSANIENANFMPSSFIKEQIEDAIKWAPLETINLSGGEPFLHPDFEEILKIINQYNLNTRINTNGMYFTGENIKLLDKYGVKMFTISLDSSNKEIHDVNRGVKGAFDITVNNIKKIVKHGYKVFVKATVNEDNVETILPLMKFVEKLGVYGFSYSRTIPIGRAMNKAYLDENFIERYFKMGIETSEYSKTSNLEFLIDDPLRHKFDVRIKEYLNKNIDIEKVWGGCTAGCKFLYIMLNKDVLACTAIIEPCGNLNDNTLKDIWFNSKQLEELRTRDNLNGKCGICKNKYICGGCRAYAYATKGSILEEDDFCMR